MYMYISVSHADPQPDAVPVDERATDPLKTESASPQNPAPVPTSCEYSTVLLLITLEAKLNKFRVSHFILTMKTLHVDLELFNMLSLHPHLQSQH